MGEFWFDERAALAAERFFERCCVHTEGQWAGRPFKLMPWQRDDIIRPLFGWKRANGTRRYRRAYIEVPRKNGKSTLAAGLALYMLLADGEKGAKVFSAAGDREQAGIVFETAKAMLENSPLLPKYARPFRSSIVANPSKGGGARGLYRVLSSEVGTKHGLNASGIVFDELHVQPNRHLYDVLKTSMSSREQPLMVMITTAGFDQMSICWEQHEYARKLLEGVIQDDAYFPLIYAAKPEDDWESPEVWRKANPGLGQTKRLDHMRDEATVARNSPASLNTFLRLDLDIWTQSDVRWISPDTWLANNHGTVDEEALVGRACWAGLDLSSVRDLTAWVMVFERPDSGVLDVLARFWCPKARLTDPQNTYAAQYQMWERDGFLQTTEGNAVDYQFIKAQVLADASRFQLGGTNIDRLFQGAGLSMELEQEGMDVAGMGQGFLSMAAPMKEFERLLLEHQLNHMGNPILRWMADNVVIQKDPADNMKPNKAKSQGRIDGIVALVMALDRWMRRAGDEKSVYEERGLQWVG